MVRKGKYRQIIRDIFRGLLDPDVWLGMAALGLIFVTALTYYGFFEPEFLTAVATVVLVVVTLRYVAATRRMVETAQLDQHRPRIIRLLAHGIQPTIETLESHKEMMTVEGSTEYEPIPKLEILNIPEAEFHDIQRKYPNIVKDVETYQDLTREYREKWDEVRDLIVEEEEVYGEHRDARNPPTRPAFIARHVLETEPMQVYKDREVNEWRNVQDDLLPIRNRDGISGEIDSLQKILDEIGEYHTLQETESDRLLDIFRTLMWGADSPDLIGDMERVKQAYKDEYDILETEIKSEREDTD